MRLLWYLPYLAACTAIFFVSNMSRPPVPELLTFDYADKLLHAGAYGLLCALALVGAHQRRARLQLTWGVRIEALLLSSLYGGLDEVHQWFVPGRSATVGDWVADTVGAGLAILIWSVVSRRIPRFL